MQWNSVPDPFVQVNMLHLLSILAEDDKEATEAVADVVTSVWDGCRNER